MVESFGFAEVRAVSTDDVMRMLAHWKEEPPIGMVVRAMAGVKPAEADTASAAQAPRKTELTQAEYDEMVAGMKANAEMYGRRRN